jgi:aspartate-semialdehyde dehydrogenase
MSPNPRRRVALVGATGVAGQQFLVSLERHPWFELTTLAASARSAGKAYADAITDASGGRQWFCEEPLPAAFARMPVVDSDTLDPRSVDLIFTAVESGAARALEERFAVQVPVITTS